MGRRRKPAEEKARMGNPGKRKLEDEKKTEPLPYQLLENKLKGTDYEPPDRLAGYARERWIYHIVLFDAQGLLRTTDLATLEMLCLNEADVTDMRAQVKREKYIKVIKSKHGTRYASHPLLAIIDRKEKKILQLYQQLCGTSASRVRAMATGLNAKQGDLFNSRLLDKKPAGEAAAPASAPVPGAADDEDPASFINRTKH